MAAVVSPPLHRGRVLVCRGRALADFLPPAQRAAYFNFPRCQHSLSVPNKSRTKRSISRNYSSSTSSNSCSTGSASSRGQRGASGNVKVTRARGRLALGGAALLVAGAALAREGLLPESFSEWDDKVRCLNSLNVIRGAITSRTCSCLVLIDNVFWCVYGRTGISKEYSSNTGVPVPVRVVFNTSSSRMFTGVPVR